MLTDGFLDPSTELLDYVPAPSVVGNDNTKGSASMDTIPSRSPLMTSLLYGDPTVALFNKLLGGEVRHFDLTWFRAVAPGLGTVPHCDVVYMGRGTHDLYTCWVPLMRSICKWEA